MDYLSSLNNTWKMASITAISAFAILYLLKLISRRVRHYKWLRVASRGRKERNDEISKFLSKYSNEITDGEIEKIISMDVTKLAMSIKKREVTSYNAVLAYILRSATVGKTLNLIANINYSSALKMAAEADEKIEQHIRNGKNLSELPALIGVPISIKDHLNIKGIPNTIGFVSMHSNKRDYHSLIVKILMQHGAIPFVCSNIPEGMLSIDSSNYLWGNAENPWNRSKVVGGSSGGEAGLVASRCSPLGIGSDIGGSIRIPSAFCGVYGFKPTSSRISKMGITSNNGKDYSGFNVIDLSLGPICRSADDLVQTTSLLIGHFTEDCYIDPTPFNWDIFSSQRKLKIGYLTDLSCADTAPDVKQKLFSVIESLKNTHDIVEFKYDELFKLNDYFFKALFNGGFVENFESLRQGQSYQKYNQPIIDLFHMPNILVNIIKNLLYYYGEKNMSENLNNFVKLDRKQYIDLIANINEARAKFLHFFNKEGFDAIICPSMSCPAIDIGNVQDYIDLTGFMSLFNVLDMPAASIPVGLCEDTSYVKRRNLFIDRAIDKNMKTCEGLPVSIMVATLPKQDEKCLRLVREIDNITRYDVNHAYKVMGKPGLR
jgi:fatty acid amide hydrolase